MIAPPARASGTASTAVAAARAPKFVESSVADRERSSSARPKKMR
jgi:hypothetical protein